MKRITKTLALILAMLLLFAGCGAKEEATGKEITVKIEFDTSTVEYEGELSGKTLEVKVAEGTSVFDATKKACEENSLEFNYDDSATVFITGIGDLNMGDLAATDGWIFTLNGEEIWEESTKVTLKENDVITWQFMIW